jgi:8-oxo-dGTP pyrophosphatase MutT (NUDIX family)
MNDDAPPARAAATLVVFRDREDGPADLLFVERSAKMKFAGGAVVFPGGAVDPRDHDLAVAMGHAEGDEMAARVCAIRETLEESGLAVGFLGLPDAGWCRMAQKALHAGEDFAALLDGAGARLDLELLTPLTRWKPNFRETRVFDTRFYVARAAPDIGDPIVDATENVLSYWSSAQAMIEASDAGNTMVIFPTRRNLERLALCQDHASAVQLCESYPVRLVSPWIEEREGERWLCIPDDLGYPVTAEPISQAIRAGQ